MTTTRLVTVWCNGCGTWEQTGHDAIEARQHAKSHGWAVNLPADPNPPTDPTALSLWSERGRRDLCPECRP